jgi:hypothetical protein
MTRKKAEVIEPTASASASGDQALDTSIAKAQKSYEAWRAERRERGRQVMQAARRTWAAMEGWDRVETQEQWERLRDQSVEDWESGATLITMLGGERYIEPERAALCLTLWQDFLDAYGPSGPAEYMVVAMAVLAFDHLLRVNSFVNNLQARLEYDFFSLEPLTTTSSRDPFATFSRAKYGDRFGLTAQMHAEELGKDALPWLDRLNKMVLRNLKALRDLRTVTAAFNLANFGQVNIGQQQTNSTGLVSPEPLVPTDAESSPAQGARHGSPARR